MEKSNEDITHYLTKEKNEETIIFVVKNVLIKHILKKKLSGTCEIVKEQIMKPNMRILGIDNFENMEMKNYKKISMKKISNKKLKRNIKL